MPLGGRALQSGHRRECSLSASFLHVLPGPSAEVRRECSLEHISLLRSSPESWVRDQNKSCTCLRVREARVQLPRDPPWPAGIPEACVKAAGPAHTLALQAPLSCLLGLPRPRTEALGSGAPCHIPRLQPHSKGPAPHAMAIACPVIFLVPGPSPTPPSAQGKGWQAQVFLGLHPLVSSPCSACRLGGSGQVILPLMSWSPSLRGWGIHVEDRVV